ncbi:MAG TPA: class I SAM-dependent methyltransferase [Allosphingosinicella sp.]|jgi:SAM-dependent methyltransferase|nr:class I SAM-dependent methyltransferase [Allosphingosinicella sp.]
MDETGGWTDSADAWLRLVGEEGDWARTAVLDAPMLERVRRRAPVDALDVGCGEGRFCRLLRREGIAATGVDPVSAFIEAARMRDPAGDYRLGRAERLPFPVDSFDLVVSYVALVDIPDFAAAIAEMARVLRPGGALLVANIASLHSAGSWLHDDSGKRLGYLVDDYLDRRAAVEEWKGMKVFNWHRPLSAYMQAFLVAGLQLAWFDEPAPEPTGEKARNYRRLPWFVMMEWRKL